MRTYRAFILLMLTVIFLIVFGNYLIHVNSEWYSGNQAVYNKNRGEKIILIEIDKKTLYLIDNNDINYLKKYSIATGKPSSPTPIGTYKITNKGKWGEGFGSRWIGLDIPWGNYGIHGTNKPGSIGFNVSAGCIRMRNSDIEEIYEEVNVGAKVVIINGHFGPFGYGFRNLRPGDRGADVLEVQKRLKIYGFYNGDLDGIYGEGMKHSLINYIKENGLELTDEINEEIYEKLGIILMD